MKDIHFSSRLRSPQDPHTVFQTLLNVRAWWSGIYSEEFTGDSEKVGDVFSFHAGEGAHSTRHELVELIPNQKVVWRTTESRLTFIDKTDEWTGTLLKFELKQQGEFTEVTFTHVGLTPEIECYSACSAGWTRYLTERLGPLLEAM